MLMLLFYAGDNLYAIDSAQVIEVIPTVALRKIHQVPTYVAGVFNYRGSIVPVIDLCSLIVGEPCRMRFSTRIIMVNYTARNSDQQALGLLAEQVTETLSQSDTELSPTEVPLNDAPYLGEIFMNEKGMIQRLNWQTLISDAQQASLIAGGNTQTNGASQD